MTVRSELNAAQANGDPRSELPVEQDVRPVVERSRSGLSGAAITGMALVLGVGLFSVLEARRARSSAPTTMFSDAGRSELSAPPALYVPPEPLTPPMYRSPELGPSDERSSLPPPPPQAADVPATASGAAATISEPSPMPMQSEQPRPTPRNVSGQALVADMSDRGPVAEQDRQEGEGSGRADGQPRLSTVRARAAMLANRSTTVPQGTLILAVLETAFDSTSPGFARALVQRDVHGFDGSRVLIPRGSRLIGEYDAETSQGQKRAGILWSRLIRPDGVTIAIGSPAVDTLGRGGIKADVNSHFWERFSGAILQSTLDLGVTLAARSSRSPVVVALPGAGNRIGSTVASQGADITPTLRVPAGRSVSVFVARDLDFTEAEGAR